MDDLSVTVFYKARFMIETDDDRDLLGYVVSKIQSWLNSKYKIRLPWNWSWFQKYGEFFYNEEDITARTTSFLPDSNDANHRFWSSKISEVRREQGYAPRTWTTEIGFEQQQARTAVLSYVLYYSDQAAFLGELSDAPSPSTPNIIKWLISDTHVRCRLGDTLLRGEPIALSPEQVGGFYDFLKNPCREVPVIFIAPARLPDSALYTTAIDPDELCKNVLGNALVYYSADRDVVEEMQNIMGYYYGCRLGNVRIYYPRLNPEKDNDARRHRYFTNEQITDL